jgi:hypothetical protein
LEGDTLGVTGDLVLRTLIRCSSLLVERTLSFSGTEQYKKGLRESVLISFGGMSIGDSLINNLSVKSFTSESSFIKKGDETEVLEELEEF